jgi:hypothetical protein
MVNGRKYPYTEEGKRAAKKAGSPKGTPGKAAGPAKEKSKTREMRGYIAPAKPKAATGSTAYSPTPMTAAQKEKARRAGQKKSALIKMKNDPLVKGAKAALKVAANPIGTAAKVAGKVAGAYVTGAKQMAKTVKNKVNPPKKQLKNNGKALTPAQLAALKKMMSQGGRLDK